ncbi:hypothetical protein [Pasteurella sp. PK-2025]
MKKNSVRNNIQHYKCSSCNKHLHFKRN